MNVFYFDKQSIMNINMILCLVNKRNITFFYQKCWDIENSIAIILYYIQYIYTYNNILLFKCHRICTENPSTAHFWEYRFNFVKLAEYFN